MTVEPLHLGPFGRDPIAIRVGRMPAVRASDGRPPQLHAASKHADELAHCLAERRIAEAEFAMFAFQHLDEALGQRHGQVIPLFGVALETDENQRNDRRQHEQLRAVLLRPQ